LYRDSISYVLRSSVMVDFLRPVERGGAVFPGPAMFGAPPSLKNTENGVPDGFFLT